MMGFFTLLSFRKGFGWLLIFSCLFLVPSNVTFATLPNGPVDEECSEELSENPDFITLVTSEQIHSFYQKRHENRKDAFNGCVLVARNGVPVYTGSFGYGMFTYRDGRDTLTPQSSFQLASTTKTFTSTAILMLVERGFFSVDDTLQKFFPDFPYEGITVKHLLTHRSGLPEYIYWGQDYIGQGTTYLSNTTFLETLIRKKPAVRCRPDRVFIYCNTNYALLGCIIEKVSGMSYGEFMRENIFEPLEMNNTFAYDPNKPVYKCGTTCYQYGWREWDLQFSDGVLGDKGIYSSVEDMLKWDNALKSGKLLSYEMMEEAYKPRSLDRYSFRNDKNRNYGYGWRMNKQPDGHYMIYHNGNWHGCNNVYARDLSSGYTVIVLGNKANETNYQTQTVWNIIKQMENARSVASAE